MIEESEKASLSVSPSKMERLLVRLITRSSIGCSCGTFKKNQGQKYFNLFQQLCDKNVSFTKEVVIAAILYSRLDILNLLFEKNKFPQLNPNAQCEMWSEIADAEIAELLRKKQFDINREGEFGTPLIRTATLASEAYNKERVLRCLSRMNFLIGQGATHSLKNSKNITPFSIKPNSILATVIKEYESQSNKEPNQAIELLKPLISNQL